MTTPTPLAALQALLPALPLDALPSEPIDQALQSLLLRTLFHQLATARGLREPAAPLPPDPTTDPLLQKLDLPEEAITAARLALWPPGTSADDIAILGAAYETLMGWQIVPLRGPALALKPHSAVIELDDLLQQPPDTRASWLTAAGCRPTAREARALQHADSHDALKIALRKKATPQQPTGRCCLQPTGARRRTGSHYTPRALAAEVTSATLNPLLTHDVFSLRICDPAMGAGVFLAEAAHQLASMIPGPGSLRAVAVRCLYGVDRDPLAVLVARLSLWLTVDEASLPLSAFDEHLVHGDALIGLSEAQIQAFTWAPDPPEPRPAARHDGDLILAAFFSGHTARRRAKQRERYRTTAPGPAEVDAILAAAGVAPLHWESTFPAVFSRPAGGFDAIIGNPPFLNAIEERTSQRRSVRELYRLHFPPFAEGAYDVCLMFWARATLHLLGAGGRYGMLSPTALLSSGKPWQRWMHERWRPDTLLLQPVDRFTGARIRTVAIIGGAGATEQVTVVDHDTSPDAVTRRWPVPCERWYEATRPEATPLPPDATIMLGEGLDIVAGCATGAAYALRPLIEDDADGPGPRLVTTGAIDRFTLKWGEAPIRYLKADYDHPRWPLGEQPAAVARARQRQERPKILVGGLTAVIEAWLDEDGAAAGVVQTWVLTPSQQRPLSWLYAILGVLNSAPFTHLYMRRFGADAMSGKQTTIKKAALLRMPLPAIFSTASLGPDALLGGHDAALAAAIGCMAAALQDDPGQPVLDAALHLAAGKLYGYPPEEALRLYRWWAERAGEAPVAVEGLSDPVVVAAYGSIDSCRRRSW